MKFAVVASPIGELIAWGADGTLQGLDFADGAVTRVPRARHTAITSVTQASREAAEASRAPVDASSQRHTERTSVTQTSHGLAAASSGRHTGACDAWQRDDAAFADVAAQLTAYFAGELTRFDLKLAPEGTPFQRRVWAALINIPYGQTTSYGRLAQQLGDPRAVRAVGLANGRNPIAIIIPCHRVIGASGSLTGYGGGLERKRWLLAHERGEVDLAW